MEESNGEYLPMDLQRIVLMIFLLSRSIIMGLDRNTKSVADWPVELTGANKNDET